MTTALLVLHRHADRFKRALEQEFSELAILAAASREKAVALADAATAMVALACARPACDEPVDPSTHLQSTG